MRTDDLLPKVFLSHTSEDKARFAKDLAARLQHSGFQVWFDEWELLPGDSLVDRVFEEGVKNADAMVVIISSNSVDKPWVREELNAGFLKRIEGKCKLIPVVLDGVQVPQALKSTVWQQVDDLDNYEVELDRIARAIRGDRIRLEPGEAPAYASVAALPGLYSTDTCILHLAGQLAVETDQHLVDSADLLTRASSDGISEEAFLESLLVLEEHLFIEIVKTFGSGIAGMSAFTLTRLGLEEYCGTFVPNYSGLQKRIVGELVNTGSGSDGELAEELGTTRLIAEHVLDELAARNLIRVTKMTGPATSVDYISPQLGRLLQDKEPSR